MTGPGVAARLDTVGISFPIMDADTVGATVSIVGAGTPSEGTTFRRQLDGGGFLAWGVGGSAWVEASLPKRTGTGNVAGLELGDALEVLRELYGQAQQFVQIGRTDRDPRPGGVEDHTGLRMAATARRNGIGPVPAIDDAWRYEPNPLGPDEFGPAYVRDMHSDYWLDWESYPVRDFRFEDAKVKRLDLVRDFDGVSAISPLLDGLATVKQRGRSKVRRYADSDAAMAETLRVGPKSWAATLYDKYAESGGEAIMQRWLAAKRSAQAEGRPVPPLPALPCEKGRLRFELRARDELLNGKMLKAATGREIRRVGDLEEQPLRVVTQKMFHAVGFDREVSGAGSVAARINAMDLGPRDKRELTAYLCGRAMGIELQYSSNTERKYRQLAAGAGIVIGPAMVEDTFTAQLDYAAGTELVAA